MKAQILSMVLELKKKDVIINEKENELTIIKDENYAVKLEMVEKNEALDIATGKANSLEEANGALKEKVKLYSVTIRKFREEKSNVKPTGNTEERRI